MMDIEVQIDLIDFASFNYLSCHSLKFLTSACEKQPLCISFT